LLKSTKASNQAIMSEQKKSDSSASSDSDSESGTDEEEKTMSSGENKDASDSDSDSDSESKDSSGTGSSKSESRETSDSGSKSESKDDAAATDASDENSEASDSGSSKSGDDSNQNKSDEDDKDIPDVENGMGGTNSRDLPTIAEDNEDDLKKPVSPVKKYVVAAALVIVLGIAIVGGITGTSQSGNSTAAAATPTTTPLDSFTAAPSRAILTQPPTKSPVFELPWDNGIEDRPTFGVTLPPLPTCLPPGFTNSPITANPRCNNGLFRSQYIFNRLAQYSAESLLSSTATPQGKAYSFLLNYDTYMAGQCDAADLPERYALLVLYFATQGDQWTGRRGWCNGQQHCTWAGVGCLGFGVTRLELESNNLNGPIPSEIFAFSTLKILNLFANSITGRIPNTITQLRTLEAIDLQENVLTGSAFPVGLTNSLTALTSYKVSANRLFGTIPPNINNMRSMKELWIDRNQVSGSLPTTFGDLLRLETLYANDNKMVGGVPKELGRVASLKELSLSDNNLDSSIPQEFWFQGGLEVFRVENNVLTGTIDTWIGVLTNLKELNFEKNQLKGTIPAQLSSLTDLEILNLGTNFWTGTIPNVFTNMLRLETFDVSSTNLGGSIPSTIFGASGSLKHANFAASGVTGGIPSAFQNARSLQTFNLENCGGLKGKIPAISSGKLTELTKFLVQGTALTGSMPTSICSLRTSQKLDILEADCAKVTCSFPDCCTQC